MCGLLGIIGYRGAGITMTDAGIFAQMLHVGALRGMHGTGAMAVDKEGASFRLRVGGPPHQLFNTKEFEEFENFVEKRSIRFLVGHNRYATFGKKITEHAHPFTHGDITLVHNGTLDTWKNLPGAKKFDVDSEALCYAINEQGIEKTIKMIRGAWAIIYFNKKEKTLNILRNNQRPLHLVKHPNWGILAFASEPEMLYWTLTRNHWNIKMDDIKEVEANKLMTFEIDAEKPHMKEIKGAGEKSYDEYGWADSLKRAKDAIGGKQSADSAVSNVFQLPVVLAKNKIHSLTHGGSSSQAGVGAIPFKKTAAGAGPNGEGFWQASLSIHDLSKDGGVEVEVLDYVAVGQTKEMFQLKCYSDKYPDVDFFCNIKGGEGVMAILECGKLKGEIVSILRSMVTVAKYPHKVYLHNPEPVYEVSPEESHLKGEVNQS